jgi:hypothetical protein
MMVIVVTIDRPSNPDRAIDASVAYKRKERMHRQRSRASVPAYLSMAARIAA